MKLIYSLSFFLLCLLPCLLFGQETAKPIKGEGVNAFLKRNNRSTNEDYQNFIDLNKNKLGKNNTLRSDVIYKLPALAGKIQAEGSEKTPAKKQKTFYEPLFGEQLAEYTVESNRLKGACFFVESGHGGPDPGAIGKIGNNELHEDEYAYDIMLRLARLLLKDGATVHIIIQDAKDGIREDRYLANSKRETCMGEAIPLNQVKRLQQRCDKINDLSRKSKEKYQRAIFIHLDSRSEDKRIDVFFYHHKGSVGGKRLASTLRQTFQNQYDKHQPNRGFKGTCSNRELFVLNKTKPVVVFAELGNIQNSFDQKRFLESFNREALANWIRLGFIKDYEDFKKGNSKSK